MRIVFRWLKIVLGLEMVCFGESTQGQKKPLAQNSALSESVFDDNPDLSEINCSIESVRCRVSAANRISMEELKRTFDSARIR